MISTHRLDTRRTGATTRQRLRQFLTHSEPLSDRVWSTRHRVLLVLVALHVPAIIIFALVRGFGLSHSLIEGGILAVLFLLAAFPGGSRRVREGFGTFALLTTSAMVVHVSGGSIEAHFHFFVMLAVVSLYQSWFPFLLALGYVVLHHGWLGNVHPEAVYNHPGALENPWVWAGIHAAFVTGAAIVFVVQWRLNELARNEARGLYKRLYEGEIAVVRQLEEAATMKDELVSVVSHELRTPLTTVIGYLQLLRDADNDEATARDFLDRAARQADRLHFLVENLLNYQNIETSESDTVDVMPVLEAVLQDHAESPGADRVTFAPDFTDGLRARASDRALRLIASNLVSNAVKFSSPDSVIRLETRLDRAGPREHVSISVTNRGPEISLRDRERMFAAFVQLDSSTTRTVPGVGLGLHIVRRAVDAYEGDVEVRTQDGNVTFTVRLPCAPPVERAA